MTLFMMASFVSVFLLCVILALVWMSALRVLFHFLFKHVMLAQLLLWITFARLFFFRRVSVHLGFILFWRLWSSRCSWRCLRLRSLNYRKSRLLNCFWRDWSLSWPLNWRHRKRLLLLLRLLLISHLLHGFSVHVLQCFSFSPNLGKKILTWTCILWRLWLHILNRLLWLRLWNNIWYSLWLWCLHLNW